jgi:hypothetical protein
MVEDNESLFLRISLGIFLALVVSSVAPAS